jgi:hypothetical protein
MKTPREILLERHQAAAPKLDAIRREMVNLKFRRDNFVANIWRELIFPSRRIWASLAAIWIFIFIVNVSQRDHSPMTVAKASSSPELILTYRQQEKLLAELIAPSEPQVAEPPKNFSPRPSSQRQFEFLTT